MKVGYISKEISVYFTPDLLATELALVLVTVTFRLLYELCPVALIQRITTVTAIKGRNF